MTYRPRGFSPLHSVVAAMVAFSMVACGGGGGGGSSVTPQTTPSPTPTSTATTNPTNQAAFICPTSANNGITSNGGGADSTYGETRATARGLRATVASTTAASAATTLLAVRYQRSVAQSLDTTLRGREGAAGATFLHAVDFPHGDVTMHVVSVPTANLAAAETALRAQAGVQSVAVTGQVRHALKVTTPYYPAGNPYFAGFAGSSAPYLETAAIPGQWDMHAIGLEYAWGYSRAGNGSGITNASAIGSNAVKIAIIDTGVDATHPELANKVVYAKCSITNTSQSVGNFATDEQGHGTDVAGIAAADLNDNLGFVGAGGNVSLMAYRVFPTPDDNCANDNTNDAQCNGSTADIAYAIEDAITNHANVISLSLGGGSCVTPSNSYPGGDNDPIEGKAIEDAINANIIVVAASGNSGGSGVAAPACDTGVIAVGATSLDDGVANGSGASYGGTSLAPVEYVTSYTQYGSAGAGAFQSSAAWGIVAPGGDSDTVNDNDLLHWIENLWTTTPYQSSPSDHTFIGNCTNDYPHATPPTSTPDCRILIDGTSMATPHVAGAAALILSVNAAYQSPTAMKTLLCQTTDAVQGNEGCGRLNINRAMAKALNDPILP